MPELPDLTIYVENLSKAVTGKKVAAAKYHGTKRLNVSPEEFSAVMESAVIDRVERVGKQICFHISNGNVIRFHLMLNGGFVLSTGKEVDVLPALILAISFADGSAVALTDPKGLATTTLNPKAEKAPDALSVSEKYLRDAFEKQPRLMVKPFLLKQELIGGIGNAYSDEILWQARISPKSVVGKIPPEAVRALAEAIPMVLKDGIEQIRKRKPDIVSGEVRDFMKVHGPSLKRSPTGAPIRKERIQSKTTYFTDEQVLYQ